MREYPPGDSRSLNLSNMQQLPVKNTCFDVSNALDIASTIVKKHSQIKVNCRRKLEQLLYIELLLLIYYAEMTYAQSSFSNVSLNPDRESNVLL